MSTDNVTLVFEGVMIGRHDDKEKVYEMGVLPVPGHSFSILIEESQTFPVAAAGGSRSSIVRKTAIDFSTTKMPPDDKRWVLEVVDTKTRRADDSNAGLKQPANPPANRKEKPVLTLAEKAFPYGWVLDLASKEFPYHTPTGEDGKDATPELPRHKGLLKPVLVITQGEFYAQKIFDSPVRRRRGQESDFEEFGYIPEQVVAYFRLGEDREIVLRTESKEEEVFSLRGEAGRSFVIYFRNVPPEPPKDEVDPGIVDLNRPSHFQLLYLLLNVPPERRYEIRNVPTRAGAAPHLVSFEEAAEALKEKRAGGIGVPSVRCAPLAVSSGEKLE